MESCIACDLAFVEGDLVRWDVSGGCIHAACCGPDRERYVGSDGEPLKDGDPVPEPWRWTERPASEPDVFNRHGSGPVQIEPREV